MASVENVANKLVEAVQRDQEIAYVLDSVVLSDDGDWKKTHRRVCRWRDRGVWEG